MNAIASLAGGVAHQFNNALTALIGSLELLKYQISGGQDPGSNLERIESVAMRMQDLTAKLVAYAKGGKYVTEKVPIEVLVGKALGKTSPLLVSSIVVESTVPVGTYFVDVDRTQMDLALSGILTNAFEALENGGRVVISARKVFIDESASGELAELAEGVYVELKIMDTGRGMAPEIQEQIFDPFFSTKFTGRGLSMPAAYGIVKNHGGAIVVESQVGIGTTVKIYLPLAN
jgi:signal transduction histidine kinase